MKLHKQNSRILISLLLMAVMILTACSKNEDKNYTSAIDPIEDITIDTTKPSDTEVTPTEAIESIDDVDTITEAPSDTEENNKDDSKEYIKDEPDSSDNESINTIKEDIPSGDNDNSSSDNDTSSPKKMIAIDAGHQSKGNNDKEPIGPGSSTTKPKVSSGTQGVVSGVAEYELNLTIAQKVEDELINRGYKVYMIREKNNVNLSNKERADMANESGADLFLRIHADSSTSSTVSGTSTLYPSKDNPYVSNLSKDSYSLSDAVVDAICKQTGSKNRGAIARDDMSGINWCTIPVTIIEMGFMSNKKEDKLMQTKDYQDKIVNGICNGIDEYYE